MKVGDQASSRLSQQRKQQIAREFNFSETVFLHHAAEEEDPGGQSQYPRVEIFTPVNEMEFAGHPVIGTGHLLFRELLANNTNNKNNTANHSGPGGSQGSSSSLTLVTKAGPVDLCYDPVNQVVSAEVPHNVHIHRHETPITDIISVQSSMSTSSEDLYGTRNTYPTVSIVKGVTYVLVDLTERPDLFAKLVPGESPRVELDEGWKPSFVGIMYYRVLGTRTEGGDTSVWELRVRMMAINLEDPACGSGACSLGAHLALQKDQHHNSQNHRFYIDQGLEMGRDSRIIVDVVLNKEGNKVSSMKLAGHAAVVAEGQIFVG